MAKLNFGVTPTSVILRVKLLNSSVTTGAGLTGLTFASAGLIIGTIKIGEATTTAYTQAGATIESITTLGTYETPTATKCRFKEVDATNHPGLYEIHLADARFSATGSLIISISGATNLAQCDVEVQTSNLSSNLTQILGTAVSTPATAGILDINVKNIANAAVNTALAQVGVNVVSQDNIDFGALQKASLNASTPASVTTVTGNVNGNVTGSVGSVVGHTAQTGDSFARIGAPVGVSISADIAAVKADSAAILIDTAEIGAAGAGLTALGDVRIANLDATVSSRTKPADTQAAVTTVTTLTGHTPQTGDSFARLGAPAGVSVSADIAAVKADSAAILIDTAEIGAAGAGLTALGDVRIANLNATVSSRSTLTQAQVLSDATPFAGANIANLDAAITTRATPAEVNTEVDTALSDVNLDHLVGTAAAIPAVPAGTYIDQMMDNGVAAYDRTTDSLQAIRDRGDASWSGAPSVLVDTTIAVVTDQTHFTLTAGSDVNNAYLNQAIVLYDASNSDYPSVRVVSAYAGATKTVTLDSAPDFIIIAGDGIKVFTTAPGTTAPTVGQVADGVWDELIAGHAIAGSTAETLTKNGKKADRNFVFLLGQG